MKKIFFMTILFILSVCAFAQFKATGNAPQVRGTGADEINQELIEAFANVLDEINAELNEIKFLNPEKLIQAMGNSVVYAGHGATQRGYSGYNKLAITLGPMVGIQLPSDITKLMDDIENLADNITEEGDIDFGISPQALNLQVGINASFLLKGLYLGARVSYFNLPKLIEEFSYSNFSIGVIGNYQLIKPISIANVITWRGISLGSGFIYQNSKLGISIPIGDEINEPVSDGDISIEMDPTVSLNLAINTVTIPLEVVTAIKLVFLNVHLGMGADLAFGKSNLSFGVDSDIHLKNLPDSLEESRKGDISVNLNESKAPTFFNFKIMTGLGFNLGPVVIDIPVTIYPRTHGYNIGITAGISF